MNPEDYCIKVGCENKHTPDSALCWKCLKEEQELDNSGCIDDKVET